jgi:hypothetical protein
MSGAVMTGAALPPIDCAVDGVVEVCDLEVDEPVGWHAAGAHAFVHGKDAGDCLLRRI